MSSQSPDRREFLKTGAAAAFTTSIFTGRVRGANDRIAAAYIGLGKMGRENLAVSMKQPNLVPVAVCDVYDRNLNWASDMAKGQARKVHDFRDVLSDSSIDVVCIATPDHWHPYIMVEACKQRKDVYVEKPISVAVYEGVKMVQAARKYGRVVQAGTMQRSAKHFQEAVEIVRSGELGKIAFVRTWNYGNDPQEGYGNPPDGDPPAGLDWDMWLGPAPRRPFNANRFGVDPEDKYFSTFRWFWDYAGGMMTDWGVHLLDIVQMANKEEMPTAITSLGGKYWLADNRETPDTLQVSYEYPSGFIAVYENRNSNGNSLFNHGYGILFHGEKATLFIDRGGYRVIPEKKSDVKAREVKATDSGNANHWANFLECVRTRQKPIADIEVCQRSTTTCLLGNVALRSRTRITWDAQDWSCPQEEAQKYLVRDYRSPWKLGV